MDDKAELPDTPPVGSLPDRARILALLDQEAARLRRGRRLYRRLLPRLAATDTPQLNAGHHAILNRTLTRGNAELNLAILKAYEQVGDSGDLPHVQNLVYFRRWGRKDVQVQQAIDSCVAYLQTRAERERVSHRLLRPAAPSESALLRPAGGASGDHASTLLRADTGASAGPEGEQPSCRDNRPKAARVWLVALVEGAAVGLLFWQMGFHFLLGLAAAVLTVSSAWAQYGTLALRRGAGRVLDPPDPVYVALAGVILGVLSGLIFACISGLGGVGVIFALPFGGPIGACLALLNESLWRGRSSSEQAETGDP